MHTTLRQLRKSAGLTQAQLATRAGLCQQDISRWERGRVQPGISSLIKLSKALGISVSQLFSVRVEGVISPFLLRIHMLSLRRERIRGYWRFGPHLHSSIRSDRVPRSLGQECVAWLGTGQLCVFLFFFQSPFVL